MGFVLVRKVHSRTNYTRRGAEPNDVLDQYRRDADHLKAKAEAREMQRSRLKVLGRVRTMMTANHRPEARGLLPSDCLLPEPNAWRNSQHRATLSRVLAQWRQSYVIASPVWGTRRRLSAAR